MTKQENQEEGGRGCKTRGCRGGKDPRRRGRVGKGAWKASLDEMEMEGTGLSRLSVLVGETGGAQPVPVTRRGRRRDVGRRFRAGSRVFTARARR